MRHIAFVSLALLASTAYAQFAHPGFEEIWITQNGAVPAGWTVPWLGGGAIPQAHSGQYALGLWNWYFSDHGWAANGSDDVYVTETNAAGGEALAWKADQLTGWYTYALDDNQGNADSAVVRVVLKRWNSGTQTADTVGYGEARLGPIASYTPFAVDIADLMPGTDPDTVRVTFVSSTFGYCDPLGDGLCLYLGVDDLQLTGATGVQAVALHAPRPWIGPDGLHAEGIAYGTPVVITDAMGRMVHTGRLTSPLLPLPELPTGAYTLAVGGAALRFVR